VAAEDHWPAHERSEAERLMEPPRFWQGITAGALCALIWGGQAVVMRLSVFHGLTPADVTVLRCVVAGAALLPLSVRRHTFPIGQLGWRRALALASLAGAPYTLVVVGGVAFAPALHSTVVTFGVIPIAATALAYPAFGERPSVGKLAGLGMILAGLVLFGWERLSSAPTNAWRGYVLFVVAATMWAGFSTLSKIWHVDPITATATIAILSLASVPVWVALFPMRLAQASTGVIAFQAAYMGLLVGVLSMYLYTRAIALLGSVRASVFVALVPIVTSLISPAVLGEWPTEREIAGMAVVILGVVLSLSP
jgi:drug/metabolite transporter (DMT)-like permease